MNCLSKSQKKMNALVKLSSSYTGQYEGFDRLCSKVDTVNSNLSSAQCWTAAAECNKNEASAKALFNFSENGWVMGFLVT